MGLLDTWQQYKYLDKLQIKRDKKKGEWQIHFHNGGEDYELQGQMVLSLMAGIPVYEDASDFDLLEAFYSISVENKGFNIWKGEVFSDDESVIKCIKTVENEAQLYIYLFGKFSSFDGSFPIKLGIDTPDNLFHKSMMQGNEVKLWGYDVSGMEYGELTYLVSEKLSNGNHRFYEVRHPQPDYLHNGIPYRYFQLESEDGDTPRWTRFLNQYAKGKNVKDDAENWELTAEEYEKRKGQGFKIGDNFTPV